jgi:hypothetical protein
MTANQPVLAGSDGVPGADFVRVRFVDSPRLKRTTYQYILKLTGSRPGASSPYVLRTTFNISFFSVSGIVEPRVLRAGESGGKEKVSQCSVKHLVTETAFEVEFEQVACIQWDALACRQDQFDVHKPIGHPRRKSPTRAASSNSQEPQPL